MAAEPRSARGTGTPRQRGAVAVGDRKKSGGWLKWLLALLLLAIIAAVLILLLTGGKDDKKSSKAAGAAGTLTAGGQTLLPANSSKLGAATGSVATGSGVVVESVNKDQGFWVGKSKSDRVYVEYGTGGDVTEAGSQGFRPKVGDRVNLTGPVQKAPADPGRFLKLGQADASLVASEGAFVNAKPKSVSKAG